MPETEKAKSPLRCIHCGIDALNPERCLVGMKHRFRMPETEKRAEDLTAKEMAYINLCLPQDYFLKIKAIHAEWKALWKPRGKAK